MGLHEAPLRALAPPPLLRPPPLLHQEVGTPGGGHLVEHLVRTPTFPMTIPHTWGQVSGAAFAGVSQEVLPPKKRLTRHHTYEAAARIQEMASHSCLKNTSILASEGGGDGDGDGEGDALRAELLRLRITRPVPVLTKRLTPSDRCRGKARLLLPDKLVKGSPLLHMLAPAERRLVFGTERGGLPVRVFDRLGRPYRMALRRDRTAQTYRLTGEWSLFLAQHDMRDGDTVEVRAFRPPTWQARLEKSGTGGLGMALLHCYKAAGGDDSTWTASESDAADGLMLLGCQCSPAR